MRPLRVEGYAPETLTPVGWRDATHVVLAASDLETAFVSVDVATGGGEVVSRAELQVASAQVSFARASGRRPSATSSRRPPPSTRGRSPRSASSWCWSARPAWGCGGDVSAPDSFTSYVLARRGRCCARPTCSPVTPTTRRTSCRSRWSRPAARGAGSRTTGALRAPDPGQRERLAVATASVAGGVHRPAARGGPRPRRRHDQALVLRAALQAWRRGRRAGGAALLRRLTERQTAELLGVSVGTVRSQARDGLARLREALPAPAVP